MGNNDDQNVPVLLMEDKEIKSVQCGSFSTFILKKDGKVYCFGNNSLGELG